MNTQEVIRIPINEIRVVNPRGRNKVKFEAIVASIATLGLKCPINVARREPAPDGTSYDLICGQGRLEAFVQLGETTIPAIIREASTEDQYLMSLVENIARRPPSNFSLVREIGAQRARGHSPDQIAHKVGLDPTYIHGVIRLIENGESSLVRAVEGGRLPVSVAVEIATGTNHAMQRALSEAYEHGDLRGAKLKAARKLVAKRAAKEQQAGKRLQDNREITGNTLVRDYQQQVRQQRALIRKAALTKDRLLLVASATKRLIADDDFVALLHREGLADMPEQLVMRVK
jgi:ParB family transcriptional regulator, chromosome partitioning protein